MAGEYRPSISLHFIYLLLALIQFWSNEFAKGENSAVKKTIKSDGDIIDCVDIYKQPAFSDLLLKNHKIQLEYLRELEETSSSTDLFQSWHKDGECPLGTIPILRSPKLFGRRNGRLNGGSLAFNEFIHNEYALVYLPDGGYTGARASFNVWNTKVADSPGEYTASRMRVMSGLGASLNAIETGWQVYSGYGIARSFVSWTKDGYRRTGCHNLDCPGFVQISNRLALGTKIRPISNYGEKQYEIKLTIKKDRKESWVFMWGKHVIGYWPKSVFTNLANAATTVSFGGEVSNTKPNGTHTTTQMGSGHYAGEGYGKAAYISHIGHIDNGGNFKAADNLLPFVTFPKCYNLNVINSPTLGAHIYYGGPGNSIDCP